MSRDRGIPEGGGGGPPLPGIRDSLFRIGRISFFLFVFSLPFSLLGMEVFQALSFFLSLPFFLGFRKEGDLRLITLSLLFLLSFYGANLLSGIRLDKGWETVTPLWSFAVFPLTHIYLSKDGDIRRGITLLLSSTLLVSIYGIVQHFTGIDMIRDSPAVVEISGHEGRYYTLGFFSHHLTFAYSLLFPFAFFLHLPFGLTKGGIFRVLAAGGGLVSGLAVLLTFSRGAWLGLVTACTLLIFFLILRKADTLYIPLGLFILLFAVIILTPSLRKRAISTFDLKENSVRLQLWKGAMEIFEDHPLTGAGYRRFPDVSESYGMIFDHSEKPPHAHNTYLNLLAESGIFTLITFLALLTFLLAKGVSIWKGGEAHPLHAYCITSGITALSAFMVGSLFQHTFDDVEVAKAFWLVVALLSISIRRSLHPA